MYHIFILWIINIIHDLFVCVFCLSLLLGLRTPSRTSWDDPEASPSTRSKWDMTPGRYSGGGANVGVMVPGRYSGGGANVRIMVPGRYSGGGANVGVMTPGR